MAKQFDLTTTIKTFRGEQVPIYLPSKEQIEKAKGADKKLDQDKLPRETVQDIILTSLENYPADDRQTIFLVHNVGSAVIGSKKPELAKLQVEFLAKVLEWATLHEEEGKDGETNTRGIYPAWKTAQALAVLGYNE